MYEVVQAFRSRAYGDLSVGNELTESQYQMLSSSEKEKVRRKLTNREDNSRDYRSGADYLPFASGYYDTTSSDDSPSSGHSSSFNGFGGGDSGGAGASGDFGGGDAGGGDGGGGGD